MSTKDITVQAQAREIHDLRTENQRLRSIYEALAHEVNLYIQANALLEQERDNVILERDVAQAEVAEARDGCYHLSRCFGGTE